MVIFNSYVKLPEGSPKSIVAGLASSIWPAMVRRHQTGSNGLLGHSATAMGLAISHDLMISHVWKEQKKIGCWSLINILSWFLQLSPRKLQNLGSWQSSGSRHTGFHLWDRSSGNWWRFRAQTWFKGKPRTPKEFRDQRIEQTYRNNVCKKIDL